MLTNELGARSELCCHILLLVSAIVAPKQGQGWHVKCVKYPCNLLTATARRFCLEQPACTSVCGHRREGPDTLQAVKGRKELRRRLPLVHEAHAGDTVSGAPDILQDGHLVTQLCCIRNERMASKVAETVSAIIRLIFCRGALVIAFKA